MRICDWSSDVCSSHLPQFGYSPHARVHPAFPPFFEMAIRQRLFSPSQEWWSSAIFGDSGSLSRWRRALRLVRHTVRLPVSLDKALRSLAEQQGIRVYAMLQRSVKAGVATLADQIGRAHV